MNHKDKQKQIQREVLRFLKNNGRKAYRAKEISNQLGYKENKVYRLFREVLSGMEEHNLIERAKGGRYVFKPQATKLKGVLRVNPQGFGFVEVQGMDDLFVRETNMRTALDGDQVLVGIAAPARGDLRRECEVLEVVERNRQQVVGTFKRHGHFGFVVPDDRRVTQDIFVPQDDFAKAKDGDKVVVSIDRFDDRKASPEGRILEVLGASSDPRTRVLSLAMSLDVKSGFPPLAIEEANAIDSEIPESEINRRLDLRGKRIFTIDPVDAQDFDDAIHIEETADGRFEVGVHIADVSHYVQPESEIDREAYARGTSVYLVDRVIPMLPEKLSNKVCSLRPGEDKLTYSCIMEVTKRGRVKSYQIRETVINSQQRFTYEEAQSILNGQMQEHPLRDDVLRAGRLARTLTKKRMQEGAVDFDLPEVRVILDDDGNPVEIVRKERAESNRLIEELMLLANMTVAREIGKRKSPPPFVYRIHDKPDSEKIQTLAHYIRAFGYKLDVKDGTVDSKNLNDLLQRVKGAPEEPIIEEAALRSMAKARYDTKNIGHYGLAFSHYTHFTSPIRRYPDLMVHRRLKHYLKGEPGSDQEILQSKCDHCSEREKVAVDAERQSVKLKQVEYIRRHLGEQFQGVVSGVTKFGIFVELNDILVEGMIHVRDMDDDYYEYDEKSYRLVGAHTGKTYRLGDTVRVTVAGANLETREVDFTFAD